MSTGFSCGAEEIRTPDPLDANEGSHFGPSPAAKRAPDPPRILATSPAERTDARHAVFGDMGAFDRGFMIG
jgi:hypothetical protein